MRLPISDPLAVELVRQIREGAIAELRGILNARPALAASVIFERSPACGSPQSSGRSLLHIATDWPGHFPSVQQTINLLIAYGADVNARFIGKHRETPLHWSASCDDVVALDTLIDGGADINADGGVLNNGSPLADATAFGQWNAARRLVHRGANTTLWDAAALGLLDQVKSFFERKAPADPDAVTSAFWGACHGGQLTTAEYLLGQGADLNWVGYNGRTPLDASRRSHAEGLVQWLSSRGARSSNAS